MTFDAIPDGSRVFLDANVFVYAFGGDPQLEPPCTQLLKRVESGDLEGFISAALFSDIAHRIMTMEACSSFGWTYAGIATKLRRHPEFVSKLVEFRLALHRISALGIRIVDTTARHVIEAAEISLRNGILSGDGLIVAVMNELGIDQLASNDLDFDRIPGIRRFSPV